MYVKFEEIVPGQRKWDARGDIRIVREKGDDSGKTARAGELNELDPNELARYLAIQAAPEHVPGGSDGLNTLLEALVIAQDHLKCDWVTETSTGSTRMYRRSPSAYSGGEPGRSFYYALQFLQPDGTSHPRPESHSLTSEKQLWAGDLVELWISPQPRSVARTGYRWRVINVFDS